jgi:hypothetical protein
MSDPVSQSNGGYVVPEPLASELFATIKDSDPVSQQLGEFNTEILATLAHLNALIDNRGAWNDGIEGCREAVLLLRSLQGRLYEALESAKKMESAVASTDQAITQWETMYSNLSTAHDGLRTEHETLRTTHAEALQAFEIKRTVLRARAGEILQELT